MSFPLPPFNVWLIAPDNQMVKNLRPVTVLDTFDKGGIDFHPDGLFSTEIFGRQGSPERDRTISYVPLKTTILHPRIFGILRLLRAFYVGILAGKNYAVWDDENKEFVPSDDPSAKTGYSFFIEHFHELKFKRNKSDIRDYRIHVIEKYQNKALLSNHLVLPAGFRDAYVDPDRQVTEDEINDYYRKLIAVSTTISNLEENKNSPNLDSSRWSLQLTANQIYDHIVKLQISGKRGWYQQKFISRTTRNGSSSVITAMTTAVSRLGAPDAVSVIDTEISLLQTLRNNIPEVIGILKRNVFGPLFNEQSREAWLINAKTMKREQTEVTPFTIDMFTTKDGINRFVNRFFLRELRNKPVMVNGYYLAVVYEDKKHFKLFFDPDELPEGFDKTKVTPATLADILHLSTYEAFKTSCGTVTRYPITGEGSIYPTMHKVRTTTVSYVKTPLNELWEPVEDQLCYNFHKRTHDAEWIDSLTPHITRLSGLDADFDGDKDNAPSVNTVEAKNEIKNHFKKRAAFVGANNRLLVSTQIDTVLLVVRNLTGDAK